jgi:hypothetical protein
MSDRAGVCNTVWPVVMVRAADLEVGDVFVEDGGLYRVLELQRGKSYTGDAADVAFRQLGGAETEVEFRRRTRVLAVVSLTAEELVEVQGPDGSWTICDCGDDADADGGWEWEPDTRVVRVRRHVVSQGCETGCQQAE